MKQDGVWRSRFVGVIFVPQVVTIVLGIEKVGQFRAQGLNLIVIEQAYSRQIPLAVVKACGGRFGSGWRVSIDAVAIHFAFISTCRRAG